MHTAYKEAADKAFAAHMPAWENIELHYSDL